MRRWAFLFIVILAISLFSGACRAGVPFEDRTEKGHEILLDDHTNTNWVDPFGINFKNRWRERLGNRFNESEAEKEWNRWQERWRERFNRTSDELKGHWKNATKNFQKMKKNHSLVGRLIYDEGYCAGNFIKFLFDDGDIVDYTVIRDENITVFDFVHISNFSPDEPQTHGSVWRARGENASIEIHDNPLALFKIRARSSISIEFNLADNVSADFYRNTSNIIRIQGDIEGRVVLAGDGNLTISNDTIFAYIENEGMVLFMAFPLPDISVNASNQMEYEKKLSEAIGRGRICARIMAQLNNETDSMIFSDANITCNTFKNRVRVRITSGGEGKVVVIDIHSSVINVSKNITVKLDDVPIPIADSYDEVLDIRENETAKHIILIGGNGAQVLVYIPKFSTHTIEVYETQPSATIETGEGTPGFGVSLILTALLVAVLIKMSISRRRES